MGELKAFGIQCFIGQLKKYRDVIGIIGPLAGLTTRVGQQKALSKKLPLGNFHMKY